MEDHLHVTHVRKRQSFAAGAEWDIVVPLRIRQAIVASFATKARVTRGLSSLEPPEVGVHRLLQTQRHVLDDWRVDLLQSWARVSFQPGRFGFLVILVAGLPPFFPCLLALGEHGILEPAHLLHLLRQQPVLALGGRPAVFELLQHGVARTSFIQSSHSVLSV